MINPRISAEIVGLIIPGVRCWTSALVCTSCTYGVQENGAIGLVVLQTAEILGLIICFAIHFLCVTID